MTTRKILSCFTSIAVLFSVLCFLPAKITNNMTAKAAVNALWPVPEIYQSITTHFDSRRNTVNPENSNYHNAMDIAAPEGTDIYAVYDGEVKFSGWKNSYGNFVVIYHPALNIYTFYAHASSLVASANQSVRRGDVIAKVGNTGDSFGSHLHFGVCDTTDSAFWPRRTYYDPETYFYFSSVPPEPFINISGESVPDDSHTPGKNFGVYGTISSYPEMNEVWGGVYYQGTDTAVENFYCCAEPYSTSYNLHGYFNDALIFDNLAVGNYTYRISARTDSMEKVLINKDFKVGEPLNSYMTISGETVPTGRLEPGKFFGIYGNISSNLPISSVWGGIYNNDWTENQYAEAAPNSTSFSLYPDFDNKLIFNNLVVGYYHYLIKARDTSGKEYTLISSDFKVGDPEPVVTSPAVWYDGLTPANLGDTFDAVIVAKSPWITIRANDDSNVVLHTEEWITPEMWRFSRQGDGSYTIQNFASGKFMDAYGLGTENGTNVFTCEGNGGENQKWFLYELDGGYVIRGAYTDMVLDVAGADWNSGTNIQMYERNNSEAQVFALYHENSAYGIPRKGSLYASSSDNNISVTIEKTSYTDNYELYRSTDGINFEKLSDVTTDTYVDKSLRYGQTYYYKVKYSNRFYNNVESDVVYAATDSKWFSDLTPVNLGDKFNALILVKKPWITLRTDEKENVIIHKEEGKTSEMWQFIRQVDGSYKIQNFASGKMLDAYGLGTENGTNVFTCEENGGENQKWFIYSMSDGYVIRAAYTDKVLDVAGSSASGSNIQLYELNNTASQIFAIYNESSGEYGKPKSSTISGTSRGTSVILNFSKSSYVDTIRVYRSYDNKNFDIIGETSELIYKDENLDNNQKYYYKAEYINRFYSTETASIYVITEDNLIDGDVNNDGNFNVADLVTLQKWLLSERSVKLNNWKAADLCTDGKIDVFDMILLRGLLLTILK